MVAGKVGEQRRLAIAGLGGDQQDPMVDFDFQPVEETFATQGRWTFAGCSGNSCTTSPPIGNDTVDVDDARPGPTGTGSRDPSWLRLPVDSSNDMDGVPPVSTTRSAMSGRSGRGMAAMVRWSAHLTISCDR
jgi:hypothetical protein